jgi:replicative DNA helicase
MKTKKEDVQEESDSFNETQRLLEMSIDEMDKSYKSKGANLGISSGIKNLDSILQGFREGDLNIIASRPSIGKTMFALTMFSNIATQGINSLYISFDKYENELLNNILSIITHVDYVNIEQGYLTPSDLKKILEAAKLVDENSGSIFLKSFYNTDLVKLKSFIKKKIDEDKIKIVFIDYLTMIIPAPTYANRWEQVSEISRSLKSMAMEFKIPFIVLCPINRNIVDVSSPQITNLSESGSIEYEADRVILLYKKASDKREENFTLLDKNENIITIYIAKNKRGPIKTFDLLFDYKNKLITEVIDKNIT